MLATLFDFPFEERRKLTHWSDVAHGPADARAALARARSSAQAELMECLAYFTRLVERAGERPAGRRPDLHAGPRRGDPEHDPDEYLGNVILLIVGGNDTTRNTITRLGLRPQSAIRN